jgi:hypothetical protein
VFAVSSEIPLRGASRFTKIHAPARKPTAIPRPWGDNANRDPKWKRSMTFQLIEAKRARVDISG